MSGKATKPAAKSSIVVTPVNQLRAGRPASPISYQIRIAEAQGQPTDTLRHQLSEAVDALKQ